MEEGAEDFGLDFGPVVGGGLAQEDQFEVLDFEAGGLGEETAVEIADAFEPAAGNRRVGVHGLEQAADEVVGAGGGAAILENPGDKIAGQEINVLGKKGDEHLQDETLGRRLRHAAFDEFAETVGETIGGLPRDNFAVVLLQALLDIIFFRLQFGDVILEFFHQVFTVFREDVFLFLSQF